MRGYVKRSAIFLYNKKFNRESNQYFQFEQGALFFPKKLFDIPTDEKSLNWSNTCSHFLICPCVRVEILHWYRLYCSSNVAKQSEGALPQVLGCEHLKLLSLLACRQLVLMSPVFNRKEVAKWEFKTVNKIFKPKQFQESKTKDYLWSFSSCVWRLYRGFKILEDCHLSVWWSS